ncbi:MAG: family transporter substrate-binding protein [Glaciihabitans sp.]|nr:family transporter substrate-binding protein [Glaciihabitans sp.]
MSTNFARPRRVFAGALAVAASMLLVSCAAAPAPAGTNGSGSNADAASDFLPCIVSDEGGFNDNSFNALGLQGVTDAAEELGVDHIEVQSDSESDYAPNIASLVDQGCSVIVATGYLLAAATKESAAANPDINFIMIDDNSIDAPNVKAVVFDTSQSGYLVGYTAASYTTTGKVGTFGGANIPPVTLYMDGFADGVARYNEDKGTSVEVIGWDLATQEGQFTGNFTDINAAKVLSQTMLDQGADIILPVGGPIYQGTAEAMRDAGGDLALLGVDADMYLMAPDYSDLILTSIARNMPLSISTVIQDDAAGDFTNDEYVGTLENGGVAISPFHDFEDKVAPTLADEIATLQEGIIDGSIVVNSTSKP